MKRGWKVVEAKTLPRNVITKTVNEKRLERKLAAEYE
jgi:hypothetical protein